MKEKKGKEQHRESYMIDTPPWVRAMAMIAAASMTHDKGFHMKPKNFNILLSYENDAEQPIKTGSR